MPTEKQIAFITVLAERLGHTLADVQASAEREGYWTRSGASIIIDALKGLPA